MKKLLFFTLLATMCIACNNELGDKHRLGKIKSSHLIDAYYKWDNIYLETFTKSGNKGILIYFRYSDPQNAIVSKEYAAEWNKSPKQTYKVSSEGFDELAAKNNDVGYEWEFDVVYNLLDEDVASIMQCHSALERGIRKIEIVSDSDFDKDHPAGSSLNDVIKFYGVSYSKYLTENVNKKEVDLTDQQLGAIEKLCSELTELDLKVCESGFGLEFIKQPTTVKSHKVTIKLTDDDGEVYTDTVEVKF